MGEGRGVKGERKIYQTRGKEIYLYKTRGMYIEKPNVKKIGSKKLNCKIVLSDYIVL